MNRFYSDSHLGNLYEYLSCSGPGGGGWDGQGTGEGGLKPHVHFGVLPMSLTLTKSSDTLLLAD